jgi:hypothetical protein
VTRQPRVAPAEVRAASVALTIACPECGVGAGRPCVRPGRGRLVHRSRGQAGVNKIRQQEARRRGDVSGGEDEAKR